jgi:probable rRNA maturation factor
VAVEFRCATARGRAYASRLRADAARLLETARLRHCELSLTLTSDRAIRALNRDYRGRDAATDVLSFSQLEDADTPPAEIPAISDTCGTPLGDIVISIDTALAQARDYHVAPAARLRTLLVHGFLHLLGYDHERSSADARRMFARQRRLEARLTASSALKSRRAAVTS